MRWSLVVLAGLSVLVFLTLLREQRPVEWPTQARPSPAAKPADACTEWLSTPESQRSASAASLAGMLDSSQFDVACAERMAPALARELNRLCAGGGLSMEYLAHRTHAWLVEHCP